MKLMNRIYKIKNKMMLSFMAIILLALFLISISSYYLAAESIKHNASEYNDTIMKRLGDNIEYYFDYMERLLLQITIYWITCAPIPFRIRKPKNS